METEFKAGDEVEVSDTEGTWEELKRVYMFFADGRHWVNMGEDLVATYKYIRKPDPDKVYREIAKEIMKSRSLNFEKYGSRDGCNYMEFDREFLEETLIEAIKKGKEL